MKHFLWLSLRAAIVALFVINAQTSRASIVYQWTPDRVHPSKNITASPVPGDGSSLSIDAAGLGYNHFFVVSAGKLKGGHEYMATIKYQVVTPTQFPNYFYMFARSSKLGQSNDIWRTWLGDAGSPGVASLPLTLKPSDDWTFYVGCKGPGAIVINSFSIHDGTGYTYVPAKAGLKTIASSLATSTTAPTGCPPIIVAPPQPKNTLVLSTNDYGLTPDSSSGPVSSDIAASNFIALSKAFADCAARGASELSIPRGVYRFSSNASIPIEHLNNTTIDGHGSDFIFEKLHPGSAAVGISDCHFCVMKNLNLDWDWSVTPIASLCRVVTESPDGMSADLTFPDLNAAQTELLKASPWMQMFSMDPVSLNVSADNRTPTSVASIDTVNANTLHVTFKEPVLLVAGQTYCVRHLYYEMGGFRVADSSNLLFDNVNIYSMPGMGWFNRGEMNHWEFLNCHIMRRPGSRNPLTTAADGFHVSESLGNLVLDGCEFTGSGDDSINIHDIVFEGVNRIDDDTLALLNNPRYRFKVNVGDDIELYHADYSPLGYDSKVTAVAYKGADTVVTFADALPPVVSEQSIVKNHHYDTHNVHIVNCRFHDTAGRGILLSAEDATIENCVFDHTFAFAFDFETEIVGYLWAEGHGDSNVILRNNVFRDENYRVRADGAVVYAGAILPYGVTSYPLFHDILIENNQFINCPGPAISLNSSKNVTVRDNSIANTAQLSNATPNSDALYAAYSSYITFENNNWISNPYTLKPGVVYDPATTSNVVSEGNGVVTR